MSRVRSPSPAPFQQVTPSRSSLVSVNSRRSGYWSASAIEAADELSTLGTMRVGIFQRPPVGAHFEFGRAAVRTRFVLVHIGPESLGRRRGFLKLCRCSLVFAAALRIPRDLETSHPYRPVEPLPGRVQTQVDRTMPHQLQIGSKLG